MMWVFRKFVLIGEQRMLRRIIRKFETMYDEYYGQGEFKAANLIVDLVAYIQDDEDGISENGYRIH